jgi:hypothetical protein
MVRFIDIKPQNSGCLFREIEHLGDFRDIYSIKTQTSREKLLCSSNLRSSSHPPFPNSSLLTIIPESLISLNLETDQCHEVDEENDG